MSDRYEWMSDPIVEAVPAGTELGGYTTDTDALVLRMEYDSSAVVVEGDLEAFLEAVRQAVQNPTGEGWLL